MSTNENNVTTLHPDQRDSLIGEAVELHEEYKGYKPCMVRMLAMSDMEVIAFHDYCVGMDFCSDL